MVAKYHRKATSSTDPIADSSRSSPDQDKPGRRGLAIAYAEATGKSSSDVLFSGQPALGPLISDSADYSAGAPSLLVACKGLAYGASLSSFRGGPVFPAMFLGAAGGIAMLYLPGLPLVPAVAMGIRRCVS
jgi:chloride channel protein, CIC family